MLPKRSSFFRSCVFLILPVLAASAAAVAWRAHRSHALAAHERELAIARSRRDGDAVVELGRRIAALDHSTARQLALAEALLDVRRFPDLDAELAALRAAAPELRPAVVALQARAAEAQDQTELALARWNEWLAAAAAPAAGRVEALERTVDLLERLQRLPGARARADERVALADGAAPRLVRARLAVRQRDWTAARADFEFLRANFAATPAVKELLPAWERVVRALDAAPDAWSAARSSTDGARERGAAIVGELRAGLWRNAVDDLRALARERREACAPEVVAHWLGRTSSLASLALEPWLASSGALAAFEERADGRWQDWVRVCELDEQLSPPAVERLSAADLTGLRVERARRMCDLGLPAVAQRELTELLRRRPECAIARRELIRVLLALGERVAADRALSAAYVIDHITDDPDLYELAGRVHQAQGRHAAAVEHLSAALACDPSTTRLRIDLLRARAASLRFLQRFAEASADVAAADQLSATTGEVTP